VDASSSALNPVGTAFVPRKSGGNLAKEMPGTSSWLSLRSTSVEPPVFVVILSSVESRVSDSTRCQRPRTCVSPTLNVPPLVSMSAFCSVKPLSSNWTFSSAGSVHGMAYVRVSDSSMLDASTCARRRWPRSFRRRSSQPSLPRAFVSVP
jgi:hypothetical protein